MSLSISIIGEFVVVLGGHSTNSVPPAAIEIPPPFQVAVAIDSLGLFNSKYPLSCGVINSVPRNDPELDLRFTVPLEAVVSVTRIKREGALVDIVITVSPVSVIVLVQ